MSVKLEPEGARLVTSATKSGVAPLSTTGLTKQFRQGTNTVTALSDFSMEVRPGEFIAIMGASGSGKSTLLNLIAGIAKPDSGQVFVDGEDMTAMRDPKLTRFRREKIGLVFQAFNLIPTLTAKDNVLLPVLAGGAQGPLSAEELLERVGLQQRRDHRPDALSGGEQQRVAIARSLISNPSILLADEPTGSLDSVTGQAICRLLKDLHSDGKRTVVVVTHEPEVAFWADRVVVLRDGRKLTEFATDQFEDARALAGHYRDAVSVTHKGAA